MNPTLEGYKTGAEAAANNVAQFQQDIPGLLSGLKTNLTSIFAKDNPMMAARENALTTYLNTPSQTRAELLPSNQPIVEGSPLNYSPTQMNSIVEARQNAALVPLLGLNSSIVSQYGNIGDILNAAAQTYQSQLDAAKTKSTSASELYKLAIQQDQFNKELALKQQEAAGNSNMEKLFQAWMNSQNQGNIADLPQTGSEDSDWEVFSPGTTSAPLEDIFGTSVTSPGGVKIPSVPNSPTTIPYNLNNVPISLTSNQTDPFASYSNQNNPFANLGLNFTSNQNNPFANLGLNLKL